jgi:hypothetical protein
VRWVLLIGWLLLILSLFYDPISSGLTTPNNPWSLFSINLDRCYFIQGICQVDTVYPLGARLFWAAIAPASIFILHTFGSGLRKKDSEP